MPDSLLTVPEVAARLRASANTIRRWLRQGRLKGILPGGDRFGYRIAESEVDRFIREGGGAKADGASSAQVDDVNVGEGQYR